MLDKLIRFIRRHPKLAAIEARWRMRLIARLASSDKRPESVAPLTDWAQARPGIQVPPAQVFRNIRVVPTERFAYRNKIADGGPVWPDFETNTVVRHLNHRQFVDSNAIPRRFSGPKLRGPMVWGGRCLFHFGHLAAEHMNRLPSSLYLHPRAPVVFALPPHQLIRNVPDYFWKVAAWFGAAPQQIHFITRPFVAEELYVSPQVEEFSPIPPPDWYLDLLDELPRLNGIKHTPHDILYVHRLGYVGIGQGGHAGEQALVDALRRAGVAIMNPAKESLQRQMELYAGAKTLIFAEGSAIHGRQLMGRVDQKILVLRRRPQSTMACGQLGPRCRELEYAPILKGFAMAFNAEGEHVRPHGLAFYDKDKLFESFKKIGIDIAPHWDDEAYDRLKRSDAYAWYNATMARKSLNRGMTLDHIRIAFGEAGVPMPSQDATAAS